MFDLSSTNIRFTVHGGADSGGVAGAVEELLRFVEGLLALSPGQMFGRIMPGISALDNLHPLFVHFPIALLSMFFILELAGSFAAKQEWRRVAGWFLYSGAVFAGFTVVMGFIAAASVAHGGDVHEIMEHHQTLGLSVFVLACILAVWRFLAKEQITGAANTLYLIFGMIMTGVLVFAADLGGLMVYKYGVAVEPVAELNKEAAELHQHGGSDVFSDDLGHDNHDQHEDALIDDEHHHDHHH